MSCYRVNFHDSPCNPISNHVYHMQSLLNTQIPVCASPCETIRFPGCLCCIFSLCNFLPTYRCHRHSLVVFSVFFTVGIYFFIQLLFIKQCFPSYCRGSNHLVIGTRLHMGCVYKHFLRFY